MTLHRGRMKRRPDSDTALQLNFKFLRHNRLRWLPTMLLKQIYMKRGRGQLVGVH